MAANVDELCRLITAYAGEQAQLSTEFVGDISWQARERQLDQGEIQVGWICGLPYVWKADRHPPIVELLVAPVMQDEQHQQQPVYFSHVIVHRDSPFQQFEDLRGATWAYNESRSHSGFYLTRYKLAKMGELSGYFGAVVESGSHQASLQLLIDGKVDATAIDNTVLNTEIQQHPEISLQIRLIDTWGPSPVPPWVVSTQLSKPLKQAIQKAFLQMHTTPQGRAILHQGAIAKFVEVRDRDYDSIRQMAQQAEFVELV